MKIDIGKLYFNESININEELIIPKEIYIPYDIRKISPLKVQGIIFINYEDNIEIDVDVKGTLILPCAITLEDVNYNLNINIKEEITDINIKNKKYLELFDIMWQNIVLEVPFKITKENINRNDFKGNGWELK